METSESLFHSFFISPPPAYDVIMSQEESQLDLTCSAFSHAGQKSPKDTGLDSSTWGHIDRALHQFDGQTGKIVVLEEKLYQANKKCVKLAAKFGSNCRWNQGIEESQSFINDCATKGRIVAGTQSMFLMLLVLDNLSCCKYGQIKSAKNEKWKNKGKLSK